MRESEILSVARRFFSSLGHESKIEPNNCKKIQSLIMEGVGAGNQYILLIVEQGHVSSVAKISQLGLRIIKWSNETDFATDNFQLNFRTKKNKLLGSIESAKKSPQFEVLGQIEITPENEQSVILDLAGEPKHFPLERDIVRP